MSSSAASVLAASSSAAAASSVAVVLATGASVAVPSVNASVPRAAVTVARSPVKSVRTVSVDPMVAMATRSAALIVSFTYLFAESTARCTSSGCIELTSNTSVISRRPATMSDVIGTGAAVVFAGAPRPASAAIVASTPARSPADSTVASGLVVISSKLKLATS